MSVKESTSVSISYSITVGNGGGVASTLERILTRYHPFLHFPGADITYSEICEDGKSRHGPESQSGNASKSNIMR